MVAAAVLPAPAALASQTAAAVPTPAQTTLATQDLEAAGERAVPVLVGGEPIIWITTGSGPYTTQYRADRISQRVLDVVRDRSLLNPTVTVIEAEGSLELRVGPRLLMVVTLQDARSVGTARPALAQHYAQELEAAIRAERLRYAPGTLMRSGIYGLLATLTLALTVWLILRLTRAVHRGVERRRARLEGSLRVQQAEIVSADRVGRAIQRTIRAVRLALILLAIDLYLTFVLGLFPWTRAVSFKLLEYVVSPIRMLASAFVGYLPKLLFVIVIAAVIYTAIRVVAFFFLQIREGRIVFANFPAEWADPTSKIVKVLLIAFGLVVAFPYLPASDSAAFTGVSVFIGVLLSLASSSALSNMIAGVVLTYTSAFRLGDRVKLGDSFGDIVETSLLVTRVRTIKNEDITIPNSIALGTSMTNYSRNARTLGLILHTSVTIGYDAPWRKVHELLITAALDTPGVVPEPRPFVWQTALNDFYVTYEVNAYTKSPRDMIDIYAALHARIQDAFYAAGVEIMSPHYTALRDGNTAAIPESLRIPGYRAPAFRVENSAHTTSP
jgi:small-conductance mechanosensitive channel